MTRRKYILPAIRHHFIVHQGVFCHPKIDSMAWLLYVGPIHRLGILHCIWILVFIPTIFKCFFNGCPVVGIHEILCPTLWQMKLESCNTGTHVLVLIIHDWLPNRLKIELTWPELMHSLMHKAGSILRRDTDFTMRPKPHIIVNASLRRQYEAVIWISGISSPGIRLSAPCR